MLSSIIKEHLEGKCSSIVAAPGGGTTSLTLYLANIILREEKTIIFFNPTGEIDRNFVRRYYRRVFDNTVFIVSDVENFISFLFDEARLHWDWVFIDSCDVLKHFDPKLIEKIISYSKMQQASLVCTSQIRVVPSTKHVYSTVEQPGLNYFIWIRDGFKSTGIAEKYLDVFDKKRQGNNFIARYVFRLTPGGQVLE
jgi:hypothetical protein